MYYSDYNEMDMMNYPDYNIYNRGGNECNEDLEMMYPNTYKTIYPVVCTACDMIHTPITRDLIMIMTNDIYSIVENELNIDTNETGCRRPNNLLTDFISVLLIRELLNRRSNRPPYQMMPY